MRNTLIKQWRRCQKRHTLVVGLFLLLLSVRICEYIADFIVGDGNGRLTSPVISFGLLSTYRIILIASFLLILQGIKELHTATSNSGSKDRAIEMISAYVWILTLMATSGDKTLFVLTAIALPMMIWAWGRYTIPIVLFCLLPLLQINSEFSSFIFFGMILCVPFLFFPKRILVKNRSFFPEDATKSTNAVFSYKDSKVAWLSYEVAFPILLISPFIFFVVTQYIHSDFWYDEINTLQNFILVPIIKTMTNYKTTNNHIFFSVLSNIYMKIVGIRDIYTLMDIPVMIRISILGYSLCTTWYIYRIGMRFFNRFIAFCAVLTLVTTIPFYNIAIQVRGYALSMMLLSMLLYYVWNFLDDGNRGNALWIIGLTALSLYTMPLNLYYLAAIATFYCVSWLSSHFIDTHHTSSSQNNRMIMIVFFLCLGGLLAILLYLPVMSSVKTNGNITKSVLKSAGYFEFFILHDLMPKTLQYFISDRLLFIAMALIGNLALFLVRLRYIHRTFFAKYFLCLGLLFLPFMFSFIRGDMPLMRIFVNLAPIFGLCIAISVYLFFYYFTPFLNERTMIPSCLILLVMAGYGYWVFIEGLHKRNNAVREYNQQEDSAGRLQDIFYNYYQSDFHPLQLVREFSQRDYSKDIPVIVAHDEEVDGRAITNYLTKFAIPYQRIRDIENDEFQRIEQMYIITAYPNKFKKIFAERHPNLHCTSLNRMLDFHNIFLCQKTS